MLPERVGSYRQNYILGGKNVFTCLKDYRTHPTSLEAALAIIIAVRSPRSLLVCCEATRRSVLLHRSEDVLREPTILYIQLAAYCSTAIFFDNIDAGHILSRKLARREEKARAGTFFTKWHVSRKWHVPEHVLFA